MKLQIPDKDTAAYNNNGTFSVSFWGLYVLLSTATIELQQWTKKRFKYKRFKENVKKNVSYNFLWRIISNVQDVAFFLCMLLQFNFLLMGH